MGPAPDRIPSSAIPVYYFPSTMSSSYYAALATHWSLVGQVARAPTLPKVRKISTNGDQFTEAMDPSVLLAYMSEDVAVGRRPVLVVARACTSSTTSGEWDDLQAVREICIKYGCWMHVECDNMSLLEVEFASHDASTMRKLASLRSADSISFNAPVAFKLTRPEDLSAVTLFNTVDPRLMDPLHVDVHEHFGDKSSLQQQLLLSRRRSGVFGSAGGAGMTRDRLSVDLTGSLGLESLSRSDSVSSAATSSTGGVQTLGAGLSSSKLLKRMSSSALFQSACFSIAGAGVHVKPTSIEFTLPWLVWSAGPLPETLREIHEVGKELTEKLSDVLSSANELVVLQPASTSNYLTTLFRFNPTISASQTLLSHPTPPTHVSHVPQNPSKPVLPNISPWESGFGTAESLLAMEKGRREAWGNRKNADIGTRFLYQNLSKEVRNGLQLELVNFAGGLYIRCSPLSHTASEESDNFTLLQHLALESVQLAKSINATLKHQATLQSIVADLAIANPADPIELCYIPPSSVSVWPSAAGSVQEDEAWVGLGGLHFTPTYLNLFAEHVDAVVVKDVDALNICLAEALADEQADGIYSKGVVKKEWMEEKVDIGAFALVKTCVRVGNVSGRCCSLMMLTT
ncbi:hypothetical protein BC830DRAFT_744766 [Chytriomyces sp. MP71]|nr:hypothetical protein BC830DRAFT_744766 [Chytriomyces sp. MP71]